MTSLDPHISVSAKVAILRDRSVLLVEYQYPGDHHYNLPGGRVHPGESLRECAARKVREETGALIRELELLIVVEYIPERYRFEFGDYRRIQVNFSAVLSPDSAEPSSPAKPDDPFQVGIVWMPMETIPRIRLLPRIGASLVAALDHRPKYPVLRDDW